MQTRLSLRTLVFAILWQSCSSSPEMSHSKNIFGQDNRELVTTVDFPYSTVGKLETGCTGNLIGRRLVMTAAHCVYDPNTNAVKPELQSFTPWTPTGQTPAAPVGIDYVWFGSNQPETDRGKDWAILHLTSPLGDQRRYMAVSNQNLTTSLPFTVSLAGFSHDINTGTSLAVVRSCQIRSANGDRLFNDCDSKAGISGAAMYILNGNRATAVAIAVSEYRQGATDSVTLPDYSDNYANVAIGTTAVAAALAQLQGVDAGQGIPSSINGALGLANNRIIPQPTPTIVPIPTLRPTVIPPPSSFNNRLNAIASLAADLRGMAQQMINMGVQVRYPSLVQWAQETQRSTLALNGVITSYQNGQMTPSQCLGEVQRSGADTQEKARTTLTAFYSCGPTCSNREPTLMGRFSSQLEALRLQIAGLGL